MQTVDEQVVHELGSRQAPQLPSEGQYPERLDAEPGHDVRATSEGGESRRRPVWVPELERVRIEHRHHGRKAENTGAVDHVGDDPLMAPMDPVEHPDRRHTVAP